MTISQIVDTEAIYRVAVQQLQAERKVADAVLWDELNREADRKGSRVLPANPFRINGHAVNMPDGGLTLDYAKPAFARPSASQPPPARA